MSKPNLDTYYTHLGNEIVDILNDIQRAIVDIYNIISDVQFHDKYTYSTNSTGDQQTSLDIKAQEVFQNHLSRNPEVAYLISEESEDPISLNREGKYIVAIDPIDGSSNASLNSSCGSIFTIFPFIKATNNPESSKKNHSIDRNPNNTSHTHNKDSYSQEFILPRGREHILSGFSLYGIKCLLLIADNSDRSCREFVWDMKSKTFISNIEMPSFPIDSHYYSINEGYTSQYNPDTIRRLDILKSMNLSQRIEGCLVSDLYRLIKKGGIYLYPERKTHPNGKLRLLYECIPVAMIAECAGGTSTTGSENILDITPHSIHQSTPMHVGNKELIEELF